MLRDQGTEAIAEIADIDQIVVPPRFRMAPLEFHPLIEHHFAAGLMRHERYEIKTRTARFIAQNDDLRSRTANQTEDRRRSELGNDDGCSTETIKLLPHGCACRIEHIKVESL